MPSGAAAGAAASSGGTAAVSSTAASAASQSSTLGKLMFVMMGVNALGSFVQQRNQSLAAAQAAEFQAQQLEQSARFREIAAEDEIRRGEKEAKRARQATKRLLGSQRAALGAQGIDIESGSALDIQEETAELGADDVRNIRNNAWRSAWGLRVGASDLRSRAEFTRVTSRARQRNTLLTGGINAARTLSSGATLFARSDLSLSDIL